MQLCTLGTSLVELGYHVLMYSISINALHGAYQTSVVLPHLTGSRKPLQAVHLLSSRPVDASQSQIQGCFRIAVRVVTSACKQQLFELFDVALCSAHEGAGLHPHCPTQEDLGHQSCPSAHSNMSTSHIALADTIGGHLTDRYIR